MVTQEVADHLGSYSACPTSKTVHTPSCQEPDGHIPEPELPRGTDRLTSFTRCSRGCSHSVFTSQWLSRKVRTAAAATSAPRTRDRISPAGEADGRVVLSPSASQPSHKVAGRSALRSAASRVTVTELYCVLVYFLSFPFSRPSMKHHYPRPFSECPPCARTVLGSGDTLVNRQSSGDGNCSKVWFDTKGEPETKAFPRLGEPHAVPCSRTVMCDVEGLLCTRTGWS